MRVLLTTCRDGGRPLTQSFARESAHAARLSRGFVEPGPYARTARVLNPVRLIAFMSHLVRSGRELLRALLPFQAPTHRLLEVSPHLGPIRACKVKAPCSPRDGTRSSYVNGPSVGLGLHPSKDFQRVEGATPRLSFRACRPILVATRWI
jgi:hypothetical protein